MIKKILININILALLLFFTPITFAANLVQPGCTGKAASSPVCNIGPQPQNPVVDTISKAANIIALVAGIGGMIMIFLGAFFYVTAGGNPENAAKARARITAGIIGMVIVVLAWAIVRLVTDKILQ